MPAVATKKPRKPRRLSRTHKPDHLTLGQWRTELRRQFGRDLPVKMRNLGTQPVFSEFVVTHADTDRTYRVAIRGEEPGVNYCSCPDYAVNTLGTCKHVEAVLHRLRRRHPAALRKGHVPAFSEVYVRYGARRAVVYAPGEDCPATLRTLAARYFDSSGVIRPAAYGRFDRFLTDPDLTEEGT